MAGFHGLGTFQWDHSNGTSSCFSGMIKSIKAERCLEGISGQSNAMDKGAQSARNVQASE